MQNIDALEPHRLARVQGVLTDIDDTVSTQGKLTAEAYAALWRLKQAGLRVLTITGRPAGWCDHIARFWPVDAVVGENGGFYFHHDGTRLQKRFLYSDQERRHFRRRLEEVRDRILKAVPGTAVASDQPYHEYDIAIDYCEDVPPQTDAAVQRIQSMFEEAGAHAKISSIHVNGWYGDFDKLSTTQLCVRELWGMDLPAGDEQFIFCGDSPNDEPMFAHFALSFGMANVQRFIHHMQHKPAFVTHASYGAGFREVADRIIAARRSAQ